MASTLDTLSTRDMIEALIGGQRDPRRLADLARGRMKTKRPALIKALDGRFDDHHAELARMLLDQIDTLNAQIATLTTRIDHLLVAAEPRDDHGEDPPGGTAAYHELSTVERLAEIPGIGTTAAQVILAEIGLDMTQFPTPAQLVSWAKLCPRTIQSGPVTRGGKTGNGNPYLKGALGEAAAVAGKTNTFLGERAHRQTPRQTHGAGRSRAIHTHRRLAPDFQSHHPIPRPRGRLPHQPDQHRTQDPEPHRSTCRHGLPGHPRTRRVNRIVRKVPGFLAVLSRCQLTGIFEPGMSIWAGIAIAPRVRKRRQDLAAHIAEIQAEQEKKNAAFRDTGGPRLQIAAYYAVGRKRRASPARVIDVLIAE